MAFEINPLNQPLADGLTRLMKQKKKKTCQFAISLKVAVVCETLGHNVPEHSSMLPCSGKGHSDSLFFLSLSHVIYSKANQRWRWCNVTLTITTTCLKNGFEIKERGVKERRIWRNKRRREGKDKMKEWKERNRRKKGQTCILLVAINMGNQNNNHLAKS